jgi:hypothetical protein
MPGPECTPGPRLAAPGASGRWSPELHLLRDPASAPGESPVESGREAPAETPGVLRCAACGLDVADASAVFAAAPGGPVQAFVNPSGFVWEILTLREVRHLAAVGPSSRFFTWFPGYAWRVALCLGCGRHLGWAWEAVAGGEPVSFWGLIRSEITGAI